MTHAVALVPAFEAAEFVGDTVAALRSIDDVVEVIVVDDGSRDRTAAVAAAAGARVVELARNRGKGAAVAAGVAASGAPDVYLLIDADLGASAVACAVLLEAVDADGAAADMAIAVMAPASGEPPVRSGFGLVKGFAAEVLRSATGARCGEPLSGQRAVRGSLLRKLTLAHGFGVELGMTMDASARGARIVEVEVPFVHRPSGRDVAGLAHRTRIGRHTWQAAVERIGWPRAVTLVLTSLLRRTAGAVRGMLPKPPKLRRPPRPARPARATRLIEPIKRRAEQTKNWLTARTRRSTGPDR